MAGKAGLMVVTVVTAADLQQQTVDLRSVGLLAGTQILDIRVSICICQDRMGAARCVKFWRDSYFCGRLRRRGEEHSGGGSRIRSE
ncbi:OLC1v1009136C1 [Oldenlandia corymbosa var. corymbosa]|uniref:OLC1v1009136C1 n=1 Tax=Oldenlandia corymbosa var. corymbosa TaxID=529605 RepID=A0AAV1DNA8_OLDCO|nr:OLC1v1009136C1 [Oldenlandia corymbosa var. corymbosa]